MSPLTNAAPRILKDRLWQRHMDLARIGATPKGGVCRLALTTLDIEAHRLLADWAAARGFGVALDDMGNMFIRREGSDPTLPPVASGSHTDTQPTGGRFDGAFGVLAAFEALEAIDDAGIVTKRPIEAIVWNNEEGARFQPGLMGSLVYCGGATLDSMADRADSEGVTLSHEVARLKAAIPDADIRPLGAPIAGFVEAHIEQGPELEAAGNRIGVVTGMQGNRRFHVEILGEEAHSGTSTRARRKDAFVAAGRVVNALHAMFHDEADEIRFTIGRFEVYPGAQAVVPGRVFFTIDFRHRSQELLTEMGDRIAGLAAEHAAPCVAHVKDFSRAAPIEFPETMRDMIRESARRHGYSHQDIYSGASHDARHAHMICPAGMVFIPCWKGISHNEAERAEPDDVAAGAQVIADVLVQMANA